MELDVGMTLEVGVGLGMKLELGITLELGEELGTTPELGANEEEEFVSLYTEEEEGHVALLSMTTVSFTTIVSLLFTMGEETGAEEELGMDDEVGVMEDVVPLLVVLLVALFTVSSEGLGIIEEVTTGEDIPLEGDIVIVGAADVDNDGPLVDVVGVGPVNGTSDDDLILTHASASLQSSVSHDRNPSGYFVSYVSKSSRVMAV